MKKQDYVKFNELIDQQVSSHDGVNFIRYIATDEGKKCSVVLKYKNETDNPNFYYGLHPTFSREDFFTEIKEGNFSNSEKIEQFMNKKITNFSLHDEQEKYKYAVFAQVLMRLASRFGIKMNAKSNVLHLFKNLSSIYSTHFIENITYKIDSTSVTFLGSLTDDMLQLLTSNNFGFLFNKETKQFSLTNKVSSSNQFLDFFTVIKDIDTSHLYKLSNGSVYYSGVMPRVKSIEKRESTSNPLIQTIRLNVERTTFSTLDAFDYNDILQHPMLEKYYDILSEFVLNEDKAQEVLFKKENYQSNDKMIQAVNQYLENSYNTHTVAVSGNLVTSDNYLIAAERNSAAIDKATYYCSVNGQSEFRDTNVNFYKESIEDDFPSLIADSKERNTFAEELTREAEAELNIHNLKHKWKYYGVSILGIQNKESDPLQTRRMHFNVLAYNEINEEFLDVKDSYLDAIEKFENKSLQGFRIHFDQDVKDKINTQVTTATRFLAENDSLLTNLVAIPFLLITGPSASNHPTESIQFIVTIVLAVFVLLNGLNDFIYFVKQARMRRKHIETYHKIKNKQSVQLIEQAYDKLFKKYKGHPILYVMMGLYIYQLTQEYSNRDES